jgi:hypothetical protein
MKALTIVPGTVLRIRDVLSRIPNFFFYPGSRSLIPDLGGEKASRILLYIKIRMKNKTNIILLFIVSGASFIGKKIK